MLISYQFDGGDGQTNTILITRPVRVFVVSEKVRKFAVDKSKVINEETAIFFM